MSVDRPTFHESWSRVADLAPALRSTAQARRQRLRGRTWWILHDPATNEFTRVSEQGWRFVGLLDGRRTVAAAWDACAERWGDDAPTQPEAIELLGNMLAANLLRGDTPFDAEALMRRQRKRTVREARSRLGGLLFVRLPLVDPDRFLERAAPLCSWLFSPLGLALWCVLLLSGAWATLGDEDRLLAGAGGALSPSNLPFLYLAFVASKLLHELAHGMACKVFGLRAGAGGAVHTLGVMFLVFVPMPYVDASSAWALRSKSQRVVVGAAGMMADLALAAVAAWVWSRAAEGGLASSIAWNLIVVAGVSTILFNANPLLRYDAYYILSDLIEAPNLAQRSRDYLIFLWKRNVWGLRRAPDPSHTASERPWLAVYGALAALYRVLLTIAILLLLLTNYLFLGVLLAAAAIWAWAIVPLARLLKTVARSPELDRVRPRAVWTTASVAAATVLLVGVVPAPDRVRAEGVVEPSRFTPVFARVDARLAHVAPTGAVVRRNATEVVRAENDSIVSQQREFEARVRAAEAERLLAIAAGPTEATVATERLDALRSSLDRAERDVAALHALAPQDGIWMVDDAGLVPGRFVNRGDRLGAVIDPSGVVVRAVASQSIAALVGDARPGVEIRLRGAPDRLARGTIREILPAGQDLLPSSSLARAFGGEIETTGDGSRAARAAESFFEVRVSPDTGAMLLPGQRVVVRFSLPPKPIALQLWRRLGQALQGRTRA